MTFVGVDLAWSDTNPTGICILSKQGKVRVLDTVQSDNEILKTAEGSIVAIDAPLIVPNKKGRRPAEDAIQKQFQAYNAGAYPANREWLKKIGNGRIRGEDLLAAYENRGYSRNPLSPGKRCVEVYPHPAQVVLFGLDTVLPYKPGRGRNKQSRFEALQTLESYLQNSSEIMYEKQLLPNNASMITVKEMKGIEDMLDAVVCAYVAYLLHTNPNVMKLYGTVDEGYIVSPKL